MSEGEIFITLVAVVAAFVGWRRWYGKLGKLSRLGDRPGIKPAMSLLPIGALMGIFLVLRLFASYDVRGNPTYLLMYLVMGAAWLYVVFSLAERLGVSWLLDAMERRNPAAVLAVGGTILGGAACYAGGNVGDGPGWWCVVVAGGLATATWLLLWLAAEKLALISEAVTVERDTWAGLRMGAWLLGSGLICGRAAAGDWFGLVPTVIDFVYYAWPALPLAAVVILVERRRASRPLSASDAWLGPSAALAVAYVAVGVAVVVLTTLPAESAFYPLPPAEAM